ncbi:branched-chain amino acid ABC transporter permease [Seohaeicola sp. SP36]|nr:MULTISPECIES: branched-chain amino acid ABC transporter permease [unclassified Seohaeicola]MDD9707929.1 branched-chain amino acid ABC transporter permease [Seohaeicola sp. 4SK31]MDD9736844.1 branched-chain amino acid ABC transporter permease [Seohaeicola sp. SP36]
MDYFILLSVSGIAMGVIYGLIGMGYALIFKATSVVNFAQGEVMMLISYMAFSIANSWTLPFWGLLVVCVALSAAVGLVIERIFIRPMLGQDVFSTVMVTIGLAVMIRAVVVMIWGADPMVLPTDIGDSGVELGLVFLYTSQLYAIGLLALCVMGMWAFLRFSRMGVAMRATAARETTALLMGINVTRVYALAWAIAAVIAGLAGVLLGTIYGLGPDMWTQGLRAFPAVILGGLDSVFGAAISGILIGLLENLSEGYIGQGLKEISGFLVILVVLMIRPYGLFGTPEIERV